MNEFSIIATYFKPLGADTNNTEVDLGIGDDCALLNSRSGCQLAISTDTLVADVHFLASADPADIGYKALAVNLSDLAAMGAQPAWFTLNLTLPDACNNQHWISQFAQGLKTVSQRYAVPLVGGDTTRGPLSISVQIAGWVPTGSATRRSAAKPGDSIYVTHELGWPYCGLASLQQQLPDALSLSPAQQQQAHNALLRPLPLVTLGQQLRPIIHGAIDISDGLTADLDHILSASQLGAVLDLERVPVAEPLQSAGDFYRNEAINFGDEYQLLFTAAPHHQTALDAIAASCDIAITNIGQCVTEPGLWSRHGKKLSKQGYQHF